MGVFYRITNTDGVAIDCKTSLKDAKERHAELGEADHNLTRLDIACSTENVRLILAGEDPEGKIEVLAEAEEF